MTRPWMPIVAMNAKASMTPPNWASTPAAASTTVRSDAVGPAAEQGVADDRAEDGTDHGGERRDPERASEGLEDRRLGETGEVVRAWAGRRRRRSPVREGEDASGRARNSRT